MKPPARYDRAGGAKNRILSATPFRVGQFPAKVRHQSFGAPPKRPTSISGSLPAIDPDKSKGAESPAHFT